MRRFGRIIMWLGCLGTIGVDTWALLSKDLHKSDFLIITNFLIILGYFIMIRHPKKAEEPPIGP